MVNSRCKLHSFNFKCALGIQGGEQFGAIQDMSDLISRDGQTCIFMQNAYFCIFRGCLHIWVFSAFLAFFRHFTQRKENFPRVVPLEVPPELFFDL